jgi:hypothetical protein
MLKEGKTCETRMLKEGKSKELYAATLALHGFM